MRTTHVISCPAAWKLRGVFLSCINFAGHIRSSIPRLGLASQTIMPQTGLRASLLVRCTAEEAAAIREAAKQEHRTISGYILNVVMETADRTAPTPKPSSSITLGASRGST